jgi:hypothetical protein
MQLIDDNLGLSKIFGFSTCEPGVFVVEFTLCMLWQLVDAALDDEGLLELIPDKKAHWPTRSDDVSAFDGTFSEQRIDKIDKLQKMNNVITIELIGHLLHDKVITHILSLARENMYGFSTSCTALLSYSSSFFLSLKTVNLSLCYYIN